MSLLKLRKLYPGYNFLPQTMPPFPWHQGGRSFHNLLTSLDRVKDFVAATDTDFCFDVSHSALSCNFYGENIHDHINAMNGRISHIHLSDAQGTNAEGLEIGDGCIDFRKLHNYFNTQNKTTFMVPEIWQGHLNEGEKFASSIVRYNRFITEKV
jgi:N-acetylneuraminate synthase